MYTFQTSFFFLIVYSKKNTLFSLYVYNIQELLISTNNNQFSLITSDDSQTDNIKILNYTQKIPISSLLHVINYNQAAKRLLIGVSGGNNQDSILQMNFMFNCS